MKEIVFLKQRNEKWQQFEELLKERHANPRRIAELFLEVTDDLSYARTRYPNSKTTQYLNGLAARIHQEIYKNKKENRSRIILFWLKEVPDCMLKHRKYAALSFLLLLMGVAFGFISEWQNENFVRVILGDNYVDDTLERIRNGNPLGIYGEGGSTTMFWAITLNNIYVSFRIFAFGLLFTVGCGYQLFFTGMMIGAFHGLFFHYDLLLKSLSVVWIHGTLEISAVIIAGTAGIILGNGLLYPGTFSRLESFKRNAKESLKILLGTTPIFIIAGFLESFVTRHTDMPVWLSIAIIALSFIFIIGYFFIFPSYLKHKFKGMEKQEAALINLKF